MAEYYVGDVVIGTTSEHTTHTGAGWLGWRWWATDNKTWYRHNGTNWIAIQGAAVQEVLYDKTIDSINNNLVNVFQSPSMEFMGSIIPAFTAQGSLQMMLKGLPDSGTYSRLYDATEGWYSRFSSSVDGAVIGYSSNLTYALPVNRASSVSLSIRCRATHTNSRLLIGFTSANPLLVSDTVLGDTEHGAIVGFNVARTVFTLFQNDATGAVFTSTLGSNKDSAWNTLELSLNPTNIIAKLNNNAPVTQTGRIPGLTTTLYLNIQLQMAEAIEKTLDIAWCDVRVK